MQKIKFENTKNKGIHRIAIHDKLIDFSTPKVMAIVNLTPDSFYQGSRFQSDNDLLKHVEMVIEQGASFVDIGGYSSRPGAENISIEEEIARIQPAIRLIKKTFSDVFVSLDTFRSEVAEIGINEGADIINDISGFSIDPAIVDIAAKYNTPYILMHMRGTPQTMQQFTEYDNVFCDVYNYFTEKISQLKDKGVHNIIVDPGFGFSKTIDQNHYLLDHLEHFKLLDHPILLGISRKSIIYKKLGITPEESLNGTIALNAIGLSKGASILRVHDVKEATELIKLMF